MGMLERLSIIKTHHLSPIFSFIYQFHLYIFNGHCGFSFFGGIYLMLFYRQASLSCLTKKNVVFLFPATVSKIYQ